MERCAIFISLCLSVIFWAVPVFADSDADTEKKKLSLPTANEEKKKIDARLVKTKSGAKVYVSDYFDDPLPKRIAVLPFGFPNGDKLAARTVYQSFRNHFSGLPFEDVEWLVLESAMIKLGINPTEEVDKKHFAELAREVNAEAVITGRVRHLSIDYLGIYGQISARLDARMIRVKTGKTLWQADHVVTHRKGNIPFSLLELVFTLVSTALSLDDKAKIAVVDELGRSTANEVPVFESMKEIKGVRFLAAAHSARRTDGKKGPKVLKAGDVVKFAARLDSKGRVGVQIGKGIKLELKKDSKQPHTYTGSYRIRPGDDLEDSIVTFRAFDRLGKKAEYIDAFAALYIDTVPPDVPTGIDARYLNKQMKVRWSDIKAKDVVAYEIHRSATPLTGFTKIGETEFTEFVDKKPLGKVGHYKILARDWAGNLSKLSDMARGRVIGSGPTAVSGTIADDVVWRAAASPYVLKGVVKLDPRAKLTIEPGTEILAQAGAKFIAKGQILAIAKAGNPIVWAGQDGVAWGGIEIAFANASKESKFSHNRFSNAKIALALVAASPTVANSTFLKNEIAIKIVDNGAPLMKKNVIRANRIGIHVDTADPIIENNVIHRNREFGIQVIAAMPVLSGNDLSGNGRHALIIRQQFKGGIVMAERNWWGDTDEHNIRQAVSGAASFRPYLSGPPLKGKLIRASARPVAREKPKAKVQLSDDQILKNMFEGYRLINAGKVRQALAKLRVVAPHADRNSDLHYRLSLLMYQTGDYEGARGAVAKAIKVNGFASHFHISHGMILRAQGKQNDAKAAFQIALKLNPKSRMAKRLLAGQ